MYRMMIVDDEKVITEGLKIIIRRNVPECEIVGVAYNGLEGYELAKEIIPDIILLDIQMPKVDGLEMVRRLKEDSVNSKFIILSGYSEFEYAKRAIEFGVKFYINKPVDEDELSNCIRKVFEEIDKERLLDEEKMSLKSSTQKNIKKIKEFVLKDVIDTDCDSPEFVQELLDSVGFPISRKQYVCAFIEIFSEQGLFTRDTENTLLEKIEVYLSNFFEVLVIKYIAQKFAIIFTDKQNIHYSTLYKILEDIKKSVFSDFGAQYCIGLGRVYENAYEISKSFQEARYALEYKVFKGMDSVLTYESVEKGTVSKFTLSQADIAKLEACFDSMDIDGFGETIEEIFGRISPDSNLSFNDLQIQSINILLIGLRRMSSVELQLNEFLGKNILSLERVSKFKTLDQLKNWLKNSIRSIIELKFTRKVPMKKDIIVQVKEYLAENFDKEISLAELSVLFFINPYYLSQLFKEKTGVTYMNYLMKLRMNKAKELLEKTDLKLYEVCEMVGYSDAGYFSKVFEKITGLRPVEYKKKFSR